MFRFENEGELDRWLVSQPHEIVSVIHRDNYRYGKFLVVVKLFVYEESE